MGSVALAAGPSRVISFAGFSGPTVTSRVTALVAYSRYAPVEAQRSAERLSQS